MAASQLPTLSLIVPNYNHADKLPNNLNSILSQSVLPTELIVADDASTDNSLDVIAAFQKEFPFIRVIRNPQNVGIEKSLSNATMQAKGELLFYLGADDFLRGNYIEKCLNLFAEYPQAGLCTCEPVTFDESTGKLTEHHRGWSKTPCYYAPEEFSKILAPHYIWGNSTMYHRQRAIDAGLYISKFRWHSDIMLSTILAFEHGICFVPEHLSVLTVASTTYSHAGRRDWNKQKEVIHEIVGYLMTERKHLTPLFIESNFLGHFGLDSLRYFLETDFQFDHEWFALFNGVLAKFFGVAAAARAQLDAGAPAIQKLMAEGRPDDALKVVGALMDVIKAQLRPVLT